MKIKKILSCLLSAIFIISACISFSVSAELSEDEIFYNQWGDKSIHFITTPDGDGFTVFEHNDFKYFYDKTYWSSGEIDYTMYIYDYTGADTTVRLPDEIHGWPVKGVYRLKADFRVLEEVIIPSSVVEIRQSCFSNRDIKKVTFEENSNLNYIGEQAFYYCRLLEEINLPESVIYIGESAFADCKSLREITIPKDCEFSSRVFANCVSLEKIVFSGDTIHYDAEERDYENTFPEGLVDGCTSLKTIAIPKDCTTLPSGAFKDCTSLEKITFLGDKVNALLYEEHISTNGVKHSSHIVKENAIPPEFASGCTSLTSITIPKNVKTIYKDAFKGCENLTSVKFAGAVNNIGKSAFSKCKNLKSVNFTKGYLKKVYDYAFYGCESLEKITISNTKNVPTIAKSAFNKAKSGIKFYVKNNTVAKKLKVNLQKTNIKKAQIYRSAPILIYKNVG